MLKQLLIITIMIFCIQSVLAYTEQYCYQETANTSSTCTYNANTPNTGRYANTSTWTDYANTIDGTWTTYGQSLATNITQYGYINYTKPQGSRHGTLWQTKDGHGTQNITLSSDCWNEYADKIQLRYFSVKQSFPTSYQSYWQCYSNSGWETLHSSISESGIEYNDIYEEADYWAYHYNYLRTSSVSNGEYQQALTIYHDGNATNITAAINVSGTFYPATTETSGTGYKTFTRTIDNLNFTSVNTNWVYNITLSVDQNVTNGTSITYPVKANTRLNFTGTTSGTIYYPACLLDGVSIPTETDSYYYLQDSTNYELSCEGSTEYLNSTTIFNITSSTGNTTINITLTEPTIQLNFSKNTTGQITWTEGGSRNLTESGSGYNQTTYVFTKASAFYPQGSYVDLNFNPQVDEDTNYTVYSQHYQWNNEQTESISERLYVLDAIDYFTPITVSGPGYEKLIDAKIRIYYFNTSSTTGEDMANAWLVGQYITKPMSGTGAPGTEIYLEKDKTYLFEISKEGYATRQIVLRAIELINENNGNIILLPDTTYYWDNDCYIIGKPTYQKETTLNYTILYDGDDTIYSSLDDGTTKNLLTITLNQAELNLTNGTSYTTGQNISITCWNATTQLGSGTIYYRPTFNHSVTIEPTKEITTSNEYRKLIMGILFAFLIIASSLMGYAIKNNGNDTGYYIFSAGMIILAAINITMLPPAIISVIGAVAKLANRTRQET